MVSRARWDEHQRKMSVQEEELRRMPIALQQNSFSSMSVTQRQSQRRLNAQREELRSAQPTLQQNSSSTSGRQWQADLDEQHDSWSYSERRVIAPMEDYLEKCISIKVEIAALELLMQPEEAEVCLRYFLKLAKRRGSGMFVIFDTKEKKGLFCGKQEALVGAPRREGSLARMRAKLLGRHSV